MDDFCEVCGLSLAQHNGPITCLAALMIAEACKDGIPESWLKKSS